MAKRQRSGPWGSRPESKSEVLGRRLRMISCGTRRKRRKPATATRLALGGIAFLMAGGGYATYPLWAERIEPVSRAATAVYCDSGAVFGREACADPQPGLLRGRATVIDGDTLAIAGKRVRLHGIDAPETGQICGHLGRQRRCGQLAANALDGLIGRRPVSCAGRDHDRYGRLVAVCYLGGTDLNAWMVRHGHALAYTRYSRDYVSKEQAAAQERRGLWQGDFVPPWEWRQQRRSGSTSRADKDCSDFASQAEAQAFFNSAGTGDPHRLDGDENGRPCERLP
ncbi:thermonuclease family protein [Caenispirillum salinarum]|uniref:thermonuclease family protein n=1 Tax=Caenispirillum salinarum TaxID=859058 RepID=UPI0012676CA5|nr:thermonuclease family protein [Caenispirillum salinarum]